MANFGRALFSFHRFLNSTSTPPRITPVISPIPTESLLRHIPPLSLSLPCVGPFSRFCSSNQSLDIDLSNEESKRRLFNRLLLYRSKQRGFLELDLVLGKWVEEHIHSLDENGIKSLVSVLDQDANLVRLAYDLVSVTEIVLVRFAKRG
ncbi:hypothetical protein RHMOL_Rhmol12G0207800 [Rhododendron molle]|uniref:Uncharacterized protein n=1 Tax=Rhododendron molle TaxID=49168 RepID=A0ACC0LKA9_RHOML|nr:hypothetical protein RHMOL_Rhmol12G0207800 [Rhododendron molle]